MWDNATIVLALEIFDFMKKYVAFVNMYWAYCS